jgi:hypothetical protein
MTGSVLFTSELDNAKLQAYGLVVSSNISNIEKLIITYAVNKTINKTDFMCRGSQSNMDMENICVGH